MTNEMIIFAAGQQLAKDGVIKYTGRTFKALDSAGKEIEYKETEEIHTFKHWKEIGYQVQKGQKACAKIQIWKHSGVKMETVPLTDGGEAEVQDKGKMFMKVASFFSRSQVEPIQA